MDRRNSTYSSTSATSATSGSRRAGGFTDVEIDIPGGGTGSGRAEDYRSDDYRADVEADSDVSDYDDYADYDDYDDVYEYDDAIDRRWIWVAGVAGAILLIAVICTVVILGGGDSGSVSKTVSPPVITATAPATTAGPPAMTTAPPPPVALAPLSPETVTTIPPSPTAGAAPAPAPAPTNVASAATSVTYQVTGDRQLIDLVTVVYTDAQGALQTEFNVALPWYRTVTLDPGVQLSSVTATSLTGHLNCSITDAGGATLVAQATNSLITTCTR